ncbi:MAG: hypothetical protein Q8R24_01825 [Legionellaceae bacterium]|nr:hypothetical protein [Legionellaceae bacterium]
MTYTATENPRTLVHLTRKDREEIQRNMQGKCMAFEKAMCEGIVGMLNSQDEKRALEEKKFKFSELLTKRSGDRKAQINSVVGTGKSITKGAPMGGEAIANTALTVVGAAANAFEDMREDNRTLEEAKEDYLTAQMLHYITVSKQDYKPIGQKVSEVLADRFKCGLFRLASGESGVLVLTKFLLTSMNAYAIKRLRQHESTREEIIRALIDAAVPPPSDAYSYREWPALLRKTLERDPRADEIMARVGPAVHSIFGGHDSHIDPETGKNLPYQSFTLEGFLCEAPILDDQNRVVRGLERANRKHEDLDGNTKYPMIMLRPGETIVDLGINFVPTDQGETLEPEHEEVIFRIFPDRPVAEQSTMSRVCKDTCYINEKREVPWGKHRTERLRQRLTEMYQAGINVTEKDDIIATTDYNKRMAQQVAIHRYDAQEAKEDALTVTREALQARTELCATGITASDRNRKQLQAVMASNYATSAANALINCIIEGHLLEEQYFTAATDAIEAARTALNAVRRPPVEDTNDYQSILVASQKIDRITDAAFSMQVLCQQNFQIVIDILEVSPTFLLGRKFAAIEGNILATAIKKAKSLSRDNLKESSELSAFASMISTYRQRNELSDPAAEFDSIAATIQTILNTAEFTGETTNIIKTIELCVLVTERNYVEIQLIVDSGQYELEDIATDDGMQSVSVKENESEISNESESINESELLSAARAAFIASRSQLLAAKGYIETLSGWKKSTTGYANINEPLRPHMEAAIAQKNISNALMARVKYRKSDELKSDIVAIVQDFFTYAKAVSEQGRLHFSVNHKETAPIDTLTPSVLQEKLALLDTQAGLLSLAMKARNATLAHAAHQMTIRANDGLAVGMPLKDFFKQARKVRQAKEEVERSVTDHMEMTDFELRQAQLAVAELERARQTISDMLEKLVALQERCFAENTLLADFSKTSDSADSLINVSTQQRIGAPSVTSCLDKLHTIFSMNELNPKSLETASEYEAMITNALIELHENCINNGIPMSLETFKQKVLESISAIQFNIKDQNLDIQLETGGIRLMIDILIWVMEEIRPTQTINNQTDCAKQALDHIMHIAAKEPPELKAARVSAIKNLKKAYTHLALAREEQARIARDPDNQKPLPLNLVGTTLRWAGRFNSGELKWWQREHAGIASMKREDTKFPLRLAYAFFRTGSKEQLDKVKQQVGELNIIRKELKEFASQLHIMQNGGVLIGQQQTTTAITEDGLAPLVRSYETFSQIIETAFQQLHNLKDDASNLRKDIIKREMAPYFTQWKINTLGPKKEEKPELVMMEYDEKSEVYSIEKIRDMLVNLQNGLRELCPNALPLAISSDHSLDQASSPSKRYYKAKSL